MTRAAIDDTGPPADACVARIAELFGTHAILSLDSDFSVYGKHGKESLAFVQP